MGYKNARDILPDELLRAVQKYAKGEVLYVPIQGRKRPWGDRTGARRETERRNGEIRSQYEQGCTVDELATTYHLSVETIRKIVRSRRE